MFLISISIQEDKGKESRKNSGKAKAFSRSWELRLPMVPPSGAQWAERSSALRHALSGSLLEEKLEIGPSVVLLRHVCFKERSRLRQAQKLLRLAERYDSRRKSIF